MIRTSRKTIALLMSLVILFVMTFVSQKAEASVITDESSGSTQVGDFAGLYKYITQDGDVEIELTKDIAYSTETFCDFLFTVGSGTKVLDLKGHSIECDNLAEGDNSSTMFVIQKDCSLIINDTVGGGEIRYDGPRIVNSYFSLRDVFRVHQGSLTINGGSIYAGHADDRQQGRYAQVNGFAVVNTGTFTMNGGMLEGRGYYNNAQNPFPCAALQASGGMSVINDGEIVGVGNADAVKKGGSGKMAVYSGYFHTETYKYIIVASQWVNNGELKPSTQKYDLLGGLKGRIGAEIGEKPTFDTLVYIDGELVENVYDFYDYRVPVKIKPLENRSTGFLMVNGSMPSEPIDWNRADPLPVHVSLDNHYFMWQTDNDKFGDHSCDFKVTIIEKDTNKIITSEVINYNMRSIIKSDDIYEFDFSKFLTNGIKTLLKTGKEYVLHFYLDEHWKSNEEYNIRTEYPQTKNGYVVLHITEPKILDKVEMNIDVPVNGKTPKDLAFHGDYDVCSLSLESWTQCEGSYPVLDDSTAFVGGKEYQVRISAAPAPGYAFDNKTEFRINGKLMGNYIGRTANSAGIQARFLAESENVLDEVSCVITPPKAGEHPDNNPVSSEPSKYTFEFHKWYLNEEPYPNLTKEDVFEKNKKYTVRLFVNTVGNNALSNDTTFYINGIKASFFNALTPSRVGIQASMTAKDIQQLTEAGALIYKPQVGEALDFEPISSEKSMYDVFLVSWAVKNGDSFETLEAGEFFKPGKVYRIEIRFEPSDDYIIDENTELYLNGDKCPRSGEAGLLRKEFEMEDISSGIYGDIDGDGYITANDALLILRSSAGMETLSSEQETAADIDCDGSITANDALDVLRYSAGLSSHENVGKPI